MMSEINAPVKEGQQNIHLDLYTCIWRIYKLLYYGLKHLCLCVCVCTRVCVCDKLT